MKPKQIQRMIKSALENPSFLKESPVIVIYGSPGCGKSASGFAAAAAAEVPADELNKYYKTDEYTGVIKPHVYYASMISTDVLEWGGTPFPVDARGVPAFTSTEGPFFTARAISTMLPPPGHREPCMFLIDDFFAGDSLTQRKCLQLLDEKVSTAPGIGDYRLPELCLRVMTTNTREDIDFFQVFRPVVTRAIHVKFESDINHWLEWATDADVHAVIRSYLRQNPDKLNMYDPNLPPENSYPCERVWGSIVNGVFKLFYREYESFCHGGDSSVLADMEELIIEALGKGENSIGPHFMAYVRLGNEVTPMVDIYEKADKAKIPSNPAVVYLTLSMAVDGVRKMTKDDLDKIRNLCDYMCRVADSGSGYVNQEIVSFALSALTRIIIRHDGAGNPEKRIIPLDTRDFTTKVNRKVRSVSNG